MLFGLVTDADRLAWQRQAVGVLGEVLAEAARRGLPFVHWELGNARTLVAKCLDSDMMRRRAAFEAWVRFFGITNAMEATIVGTRSRLHGSTTDFRGCQVLVLADLYSDDAEAGDLS